MNHIDNQQNIKDKKSQISTDLRFSLILIF